LEELMGLHVDEHIHIPGGAAIEAFLPLGLKPEARTVVNPCRNFDVDASVGQHPAVALALPTGGRDDDPFPATFGAGRPNGQKALGAQHLAAPLTRGTACRASAILATRPATGQAHLGSLELDIDLFALARFEEAEGEIVPQVGSLLTTGMAAATLAESQEVLEEVPEGGEDIGRARESSIAHPLQALDTVAIVDFPLFRIAQHLIGFRGFLKFFLGRFIAWIAVRMVLQGELPIGFLDVIRRRTALDP
jgi:hypothetical protein